MWRRSLVLLRDRCLAAMLRSNLTKGSPQVLASRKRLLGGLRGHILEIGPGIGVNLPYYPPDVRWTGVEPNPFLQDDLRNQARQRDLDARVLNCPIGAAGLSPQAYDYVVVTLVLCSVQSPREVLEIARRALKPGGNLVFIEHVAAPRGTWTRAFQEAICPCARLFAGGCRPNRELLVDLEQAGFASISYERFDVSMRHVPWGPHLAGVATA